MKSEVSEAKGGDHQLSFAHKSDEKGRGRVIQSELREEEFTAQGEDFHVRQSSVANPRGRRAGLALLKWWPLSVEKSHWCALRGCFFCGVKRKHKYLVRG